MGIKEIMHEPTFVSANATVLDAAKAMAKRVVGSVIVGSADNALGIFSERDLLIKVVAKEIDYKKAKVRDHMTSPVMTLDVNMSVSDAQEIMTRGHIRRLPITNNGRIIGIISARSLMEHLKYEYVKRSVEDSERVMYGRYW